MGNGIEKETSPHSSPLVRFRFAERVVVDTVGDWVETVEGHCGSVEVSNESLWRRLQEARRAGEMLWGERLQLDKVERLGWKYVETPRSQCVWVFGRLCMMRSF
jgi:hypothetical protein